MKLHQKSWMKASTKKKANRSDFSSVRNQLLSQVVFGLHPLENGEEICLLLRRTIRFFYSCCSAFRCGSEWMTTMMIYYAVDIDGLRIHASVAFGLIHVQ